MSLCDIAEQTRSVMTHESSRFFYEPGYLAVSKDHVIRTDEEEDFSLYGGAQMSELCNINRV